MITCASFCTNKLIHVCAENHAYTKSAHILQSLTHAKLNKCTMDKSGNTEKTDHLLLGSFYRSLTFPTKQHVSRKYNVIMKSRGLQIV